MTELTDRQEQFLNTIRSFCDLHGYSPSIREIGDHLGIRSPNGVMCHVRTLLKKGVLTGDPRKARSLRVVDPDRIMVSRRHLEQALHECLDGQYSRAIALLEELLSTEVVQ